MAFHTKRIQKLESEVKAQAAEIAALKAAQGPALAAPVAAPARADEVKALREALATLSAEHTSLRQRVDAEAKAREAAAAPAEPSRPRTTLEVAMALEDARMAAIPVDRSQVASMLTIMARSTYGNESIYRLAGSAREFVEAVATVRVLEGAGLIEMKHAQRADTRITLTESGRLVAEQILGVPVRFTPPKPAETPAPASPDAPVATVASGEAGKDTAAPATAEAPAAPEAAVATPLARGLSALAAIEVVRAEGSHVGAEVCRRVLDAVLVYSDQPLDSVAKRNGIPLFDAAEAARVLRDAGLMVIANGKRLRPTAEGRTFGFALRELAKANAPAPAAPEAPAAPVTPPAPEREVA